MKKAPTLSLQSLFKIVESIFRSLWTSLSLLQYSKEIQTRLISLLSRPLSYLNSIFPRHNQSKSFITLLNFVSVRFRLTTHICSTCANKVPSTTASTIKTIMQLPKMIRRLWSSLNHYCTRPICSWLSHRQLCSSCKTPWKTSCQQLSMKRMPILLRATLGVTYILAEEDSRCCSRTWNRVPSRRWSIERRLHIRTPKDGHHFFRWTQACCHRSRRKYSSRKILAQNVPSSQSWSMTSQYTWFKLPTWRSEMTTFNKWSFRRVSCTGHYLWTYN